MTVYTSLASKLSRLAAAVSIIFPAVALAGGVIGGGGGGNTLRHQKVNLKELEQAIVDSQGPIVFFLQAMELRRAHRAAGTHQPYDPVFEKLFQPGMDFIELVKKTGISLNSNGPCIAPDSKATDGSADASNPRGICISTHRLLNKINKSNVFSEVPALILHELSHLAGTSESEAVLIQKIAIEAFRAHPSIHGGEDAMRSSMRLESVLRLTEAAVAAGANVRYEDLYSIADQMFDFRCRDLDIGCMHDIVLVPIPQNYDYFGQLEVMVTAMGDYVCSLEKKNRPAEVACRHEYTMGFPAGSESTSARYYRRGVDWFPLVDVSFNKISDPLEMKRQLSQIISETEKMTRTLQDIDDLRFRANGCKDADCVPWPLGE